MKVALHVGWEIALVLASVLVFRSLWLLMDQVSELSSPVVLAVLLVVGFLLMGLSLRRLTHADK